MLKMNSGFFTAWNAPMFFYPGRGHLEKETGSSSSAIARYFWKGQWPPFFSGPRLFAFHIPIVEAASYQKWELALGIHSTISGPIASRRSSRDTMDAQILPTHTIHTESEFSLKDRELNKACFVFKPVWHCEVIDLLPLYVELTGWVIGWSCLNDQKKCWKEVS